MSNLLKIQYQHIFLFDTGPLCDLKVNPLKDFLYFLKFEGQKGIIDFSYSWEKDSLHSNLTIKENLLLDSIPTSLIRDNENNLKEFFKTLENPYLIKLFEALGNLNDKVANLSIERLKLTSLIKAMVSKSEFVFLVEPESFDSYETIATLKQCILFEVDTHQRKFMIKPSQKETWLDITTHLITKDEKHSYIKKTIESTKSKQTSDIDHYQEAKKIA